MIFRYILYILKDAEKFKMFVFMKEKKFGSKKSFNIL